MERSGETHMSDKTDTITPPSHTTRREMRDSDKKDNVKQKRNKPDITTMDDYELLQESIGYQMTNSRIFNYMVKKPLVINCFCFVIAAFISVFYSQYSTWAWGTVGLIAVPIAIGTVLIILNVRQVRAIEELRHPMLVEYLKSIKKEIN